jgi:spore coat polysaccharide biosynthesis protein SpsF
VRIGALVQARMSSQRLPQKVLRPIAGKPAIGWLIERLEHAQQLDSLAVATSYYPTDDPIAEWCLSSGVRCHRGSLDNVAERILEAARLDELDAFVRISADSPLLDQALVDEAVQIMRTENVDLVTNIAPRTFPAGQSVEVVLTSAFERVLENDLSDDEREHVTLALYQMPDSLKIRNFTTEPACTSAKHSLDTEADAERIESFLKRLKRPHWETGWREIS